MILIVLGACAVSAQAQSFEAGIHFASSQWSEFDGADYGVGGRIAWLPVPLIGIEADITWYPSDFQPDGFSFSRQRLEGLFGATIGPKVNRVRPFAKAAAGFLKVSPTGGAFACIAIFPPPLACVLAGGTTLPAYEFGGGIEVGVSTSTFIRGDLTDRILKYPGPTLTRDFTTNEDGFYGHALRVTVGGGIRF